MKIVERIVVGVDLTGGEIGGGAKLAIEQAQWISETTGAHVTLLHSTAPDEEWDPNERQFSATGSAGRGALDVLEATAQRLRDAGIDCALEIVEDSAAHAIVQQVLREEADLVILGKRVNEVHDGRRIGSISLNVLRNCPGMISVVKPGASSRPHTIVAATDAGPVGARVVRAASRMSTACGAALHVIHAIQLTMEVQMEGSEERYVKERRDAVRDEARAQAAEAGFEGELEVHAGLTTPSRAALDAEKHLHPELIVMGSVSRGGVPGLLIGNTAERLLAMLDCSLLVVKPEDFICPVTLDE